MTSDTAQRISDLRGLIIRELQKNPPKMDDIHKAIAELKLLEQTPRILNASVPSATFGNPYVLDGIHYPLSFRFQGSQLHSLVIKNCSELDFINFKEGGCGDLTIIDSSINQIQFMQAPIRGKIHFKGTKFHKEVNLKEIGACEEILFEDVECRTLYAFGNSLKKITLTRSTFTSEWNDRDESRRWINAPQLAEFSIRECKFLAPVGIVLNHYNPKTEIAIFDSKFSSLRFMGGQIPRLIGTNLSIDDTLEFTNSQISVTTLQHSTIHSLKASSQHTGLFILENVLNNDSSFVLGNDSGLSISKSKILDLKISNAPNDSRTYEVIDLSTSEIEKFDMSPAGGGHFLKVNNLYAVRSTFERARIFNVTLLECCDFNYATFSEAPNFDEAIFPHDSKFVETRFPDRSTSSAGAHYRALKFKMDKLHNEHARMLFASLELESRRRELPRLNVERWTSWFYSIFNGYGQNTGRPLWWIIITFVIMSFFYSQDYRIKLNPKYSIDNQQKYKEIWLGDLEETYPIRIETGGPFVGYRKVAINMNFTAAGITYAFVNSLVPIRVLPGFDILSPKSLFIQIIGIIHSIFSTIWLYLFIANVRRKLSIN